MNRLRLFIEMIGNALARTRAEQATQEALDEVRRLRDQLQRENVYLQQEGKAIRGHALLIGNSAALRNVLGQVEQVAATNASVLLIGETGTGKEWIASAIHESSFRAARPVESICMSCLLAVGIFSSEEELAAMESEHACQGRPTDGTDQLSNKTQFLVDWS
ncbi:MAG: sigma 54-interacting transcriptional regulator [Candidatus Korobacteraceae bacterium]